jgi:hypothetical protein
MDKVDELKMKFQIERLGKLAVINLETVMRLQSAIENIPNVPQVVLDDARKASLTIDEQIQVLQELFGMETTRESK